MLEAVNVAEIEMSVADKVIKIINAEGHGRESGGSMISVV